MTPEAINQATVAQVSYRCVPVLEKQQVIGQSMLMKLWISQPTTNKAPGCFQPIKAGSLEREEPPLQFMTPRRHGEVPYPRQQPGPNRTLLETCTVHIPRDSDVRNWKTEGDRREGEARGGVEHWAHADGYSI